MWTFFRKKTKENYPVVDIPLADIKKAIETYALSLPEETPLSILINEDLSLKNSELAPILQALPLKKFYMSLETYDVFDEEGKHLAEELDTIQRAVDHYYNLNNEMPIIHGDPYLKVSFHKLIKHGLLTYRPTHAFYIDPIDKMITHKRPK
ncbi:Protein of unknown function [Amphibacillus marinus]|uniref:DUF3939 domain-containing protein n=1 Tax=Amphibacillus marinus TaxID=872970 RepID=A0A1H8RWH0_9BACI|nr:DUF3939 domain-containing protein [Amphibacillus marinus]SEO70273.1 Protein of unknown function [Amphibacillus marinus]